VKYKFKMEVRIRFLSLLPRRSEDL
jgi:hypothetical protein